MLKVIKFSPLTFIHIYVSERCINPCLLQCNINKTTVVEKYITINLRAPKHTGVFVYFLFLCVIIMVDYCVLCCMLYVVCSLCMYCRTRICTCRTRIFLKWYGQDWQMGIVRKCNMYRQTQVIKPSYCKNE